MTAPKSYLTGTGVVFRNNAAVLLWGFAAAFLAFDAATTYVLFRDGALSIPVSSDIPTYYPPWAVPAIVTAFWIGGLGLAGYAASRHCLRLAVLAGGAVAIRKRYPFRSETRIVPKADLNPAEVVKSKDDDGDPYFYARLALLDGTRIDIREGHHEADCVDACGRFNDALWGTSPLEQDV